MKNKVYLCIAPVVFLMSCSILKMNSDLKVNSAIEIKRDSEVLLFSVTDQIPKRINPEYFYAWFASGSVNHTQGAAFGKPLHGKFLLSTYSGQPIEQGLYQYGLKEGVWQTWYVSGVKRSFTEWENGQLHGEYKEWNEEGRLITTLKYKNGEPILKKVSTKIEAPSDSSQVKPSRKTNRKFYKKKVPKEDDSNVTME